jgi:hypothetical protein
MKVVGMTGFEPATSASRTQRSTKLSHIPTGIYYGREAPNSMSFQRPSRPVGTLYQTEPHPDRHPY